MARDGAVRVMIVDDHADVRSWFRLSLLAIDDLELVAEAGSCQEALAALILLVTIQRRAWRVWQLSPHGQEMAESK